MAIPWFRGKTMDSMGPTEAQRHVGVWDEGLRRVARYGGFDLRLTRRHDARVEVHLGGEAQGVLRQDRGKPWENHGKTYENHGKI